MSQKSERLSAYSITEHERGRSTWLKVGTAFVNRDGSINIYLEALPLSGKLQLRKEDPKDEESAAPAPGAAA